MFRHSKQQINGFRRIASVLMLAAMTALLAFLSVPTGHAAAKTLTASSLETYVFNLINNDRAANGLPSYIWDDSVADVARAHSNVMASGSCPQHQCPGEPGLADTRLTNAGVGYSWWGENIGNAYGQGSDEANLQYIHQLFINEGPENGDGQVHGHYENIMSTNFQNVGVGVVIDGSGTAWVTEDFIRP